MKSAKAWDMIRAEKVNPYYFYPASYKEKADVFFQSYKIEKEIGCPTEKIKGLKEKKLRVCRFCHKRYPLVTFSKDAHIISELLGNRYLVSDFECDECNSKFGKYESDFANFLGIARTVQSIKGKKIPKFKSADKKFSAESVTDPQDGNVIKLKRFDPNNATFTFDKEKLQTVVAYQKGPYTPLKVYKAILKMALSIIDEKHLNDYSFALEYLTHRKHDENYRGFAFLTTYVMPLNFQFEAPAAMLFTKMNPFSEVASHVFYLSALNFIFQIMLPFNKRDAFFYQKPGGFDALWCPPLFGDEEDRDILQVQSMSIDLNSTERLYNQPESFTIPAGPEMFADSQLGNKQAGDEIPFDPEKIIGIDILKIDNSK